MLQGFVRFRVVAFKQPGEGSFGAATAHPSPGARPFPGRGGEGHLEGLLRRHADHALPDQFIVQRHGQRVHGGEAQRDLPLTHQPHDAPAQPAVQTVPRVPPVVAPLIQRSQVQQRSVLRPLVPYVVQGEHDVAAGVRMGLAILGAAPLAPVRGAVLDDEAAAQRQRSGQSAG